MPVGPRQHVNPIKRIHKIPIIGREEAKHITPLGRFCTVDGREGNAVSITLLYELLLALEQNVFK